MIDKHKISFFLQSTQITIDHRICKYYLPLTIVLFLIVTYSYITRSIVNVDWHAWAVGDWLINYSAGFVRRGLLGELILSISDYFDFKPNVIAVFTQIFFWFFFAALFLFRLFNKKITLFFFLLIFSPAFVIFYIFDTAAIGRKEIILMVLFSLWLYELEKYKCMPKKIVLIYSILIFLITLMHEMFFFYSPYFLFAMWLKSTNNNSRELLKSSILIFASFAAVVFILFFGGSLQAPEICQRLITYEQKPQICTGILAAAELPFIESTLLFFGTLSPLKLLSLLFSPVIPIFSISLYLNSVRSPLRSPRKIIITCLSLYAFSFPLFVIATDWGRFIHLHVVLLTLCMTLLLTTTQFSISNSNQLDGKNIFSSYTSIGKFLLTIGCIVILTFPLWRLKHCCIAYVDLFFPIKKIIELF